MAVSVVQPPVLKSIPRVSWAESYRPVVLSQGEARCERGRSQRARREMLAGRWCRSLSELPDDVDPLVEDVSGVGSDALGVVLV